MVVQFALQSSCASVNQQIIVMMPLRLCEKCAPGLVDMRCDQSGSIWPTAKRKSAQCLWRLILRQALQPSLNVYDDNADNDVGRPVTCTHVSSACNANRDWQAL